MITEGFIVRLLEDAVACLYNAVYTPRPHGYSLDLWPAKKKRFNLSVKCQQPITFPISTEWDLPPHCFSVHILAVSHFTLQVCQNSTSSAAKYHKNKYSHRRCWTPHAPQLTDSAWHERIRRRSFSTSTLDEVLSPAPSVLDVSWL